MFSHFLTDVLGPIGALWWLVDWGIRIGSLFFVPKNRSPSSGSAWLLFIFFFPTLGLIAFLIFGNPKLPRRRQNAQKTLDSVIGGVLKEYRQKYDKHNLLSAEVPKDYHALSVLGESLTGLPAFAGNKVTVLPEYNEVIPHIIKDIDAAKHYVHLEYFIICMDELTLPIFDALKRAVDRGVVVRVLYDSLSTKRYPKWKDMLARFEQDGVNAEPMLPLKMPGKGYVRPDLRNHRKLVVIDGHIGYTGSQNLVQRNYHRKDDIYYDELVVRLAGPIAMQLSAVFLTDWYSETGQILEHKDMQTKPQNVEKAGDSVLQILPSGPGYIDENNLKLFTGMIHNAHNEVVLVNPYFVPHDALLTALTSAAQRGVRVKLINSEVMDQWMVGHAQRSYYEMLLKAGVEVHLYKAPILLHSKFIVVDGTIATVGSSNLDLRSFYLDLEVTLVAYDPKVAKQLHAVAETYLKRSNQLSLKKWQKRPYSTQLKDNIARLTAALQ